MTHVVGKKEGERSQGAGSAGEMCRGEAEGAGDTHKGAAGWAGGGSDARGGGPRPDGDFGKFSSCYFYSFS